MNWRDRITSDPAVLAGKPVVAGTRVSVELVVDLLAHGWSAEAVQREYGITEEDVRACVAWRASHPAMASEAGEE